MRVFFLCVVTALVLSASIASAVPITNGLVAAYEFSGNADDSSGNGNHGVVNGATLTADRFGNPNSAYDFDGGSSVINAGSVLATDQQQLTVSSWFYRRSPLPASYTSNILNQANGNGDSAGFSLMLKESTGGNSFVRFLWNDQQGGRSDVTTGEVAYLQWNHVVGVYDGGTQSIYLNGLLVNAISNTGAITFPSGPFRIGHEDRPEVAGFDGLIDDVYVFDRALSPGEIQVLYSVVPEPGTALLMGLGLAGLASRRQ